MQMFARMRYVNFIALVTLSLVIVATASIFVTRSAHAAGTTYYVATTGNDANAGTSTSAPFKTIQKCATVVTAGGTCQIAAGTYHETVTPAHTGTAGAPITFTSAPGARVTVDGTNTIGGWTLYSGHIYRAAVTLSGTAAQPYSATEYPSDSDLWANQIFINNTVTPEAAYPTPSTDPWNQAFITSGWSSTRSSSATCAKAPCTTTLTGTLTDKSFPAFGNLTGAVAYFAGGWVALSAKVTGGTLSGSNKTLNISFPESDAKVEPGGGNDNKFRLVGSRAFLTAQNEWFYDAGAHELYLWAPGGGVPTGVTAKARNYGFDLNNRAYINITAINLWATTITTNDSSQNIVLNEVNGEYLSFWQTAQYDTTLPFAGIYDANHRFDSGILLHGTNDTLENSTLQQSSGNGVNLRGSGHTVTNDLIHDVSYGGTYTAAITIEVGSSNHSIIDNTLYNIGRDAINMDTNAYPNAGYKNMRIAYNNIYGYAKIAFDLGGIYVCCDTSLAGTRIDHNRIHDPANTGNGIHFDNGTYDVSVDHNVIWGLKGTGDINHGGNGINFGGHTNGRPAGSNLPYLTGSIQNNTIIAGKNDTIFNYFATSSYVANTIVRNNILDGAHPSGQDYGYISGGKPVEKTNLVTTLSDNGAGTNPKYANPSGGNYTLQAGSPAINAGTVIPGITNGYVGSAPDIGAYESGATQWLAGCLFTGCGRA
jgi:Protein of unknown function (DUF1565)